VALWHVSGSLAQHAGRESANFYVRIPHKCTKFITFMALRKHLLRDWLREGMFVVACVTRPSACTSWLPQGVPYPAARNLCTYTVVPLLSFVRL
jgi:hypothetical protein